MLSQIQNVDPDFLKSFALLVVGLLAVAASIAGIYRVLNRNKESRTVTFQPPELSGEFKVIPKGRRFSAEACDTRHESITNRLDGHDKQIHDLWFTMREEDSRTRAALSNAVRDFDRTINRVDGTMSEANKVQAIILEKLLSERNQST